MNKITNRRVRKHLILVAILLLIIIFAIFIKNSNSAWEDNEKMHFGLNFIGLMSSENPMIMVNTIDGIQNISEIITDGTFQNGLNSWNKKGKVSIIADNADKNNLQIGEAYSSNLISENCIFQDVFFKEGLTHILFEYEFFTEDDLIGFDDLAFAVLIDNNLVHLEAANPDKLELQKSIINLNFQESANHQIKICAGNSGDRNNSSWINLYKISSNVAVLNPSSSLVIKKYGNNVCIKYEIDDEIFESCSQNQLSVTFNQPVTDELSTIQLDDFSFELPLFVYSEQPSAIQNANICILDDRRLALYYPRISGLLQNLWLKYSYGLNADWENAIATKPVFSDLSLDLQRASCTNERCIIFFETLDQHSFQLEDNLTVLVKQCDHTDQCSDVFMPEITQSCEELVMQNDISSVVINEIMFNPNGDDNVNWYEGEWIELFNPNMVAINLNNYVINDAAGWQVSLSQENCDNNSNINDGGEIVISPNGFLVVFMSKAILNNSGDSIYLYDNQGKLSDQVIYPGHSQENVIYGRYPNGADSWINSFFPTPLSPNLPE